MGLESHINFKGYNSPVILLIFFIKIENNWIYFEYKSVVKETNKSKPSNSE